MSNEKNIVHFDQVNEMLENDPAYLTEFYEAAITSFTQFRDDFTKNMRERDLESLRKTGHRIKPVAEMIGTYQIPEAYEEAKEILQENAAEERIQDSIKKVQSLCKQIIAEFQQEIEKIN